METKRCISSLTLEQLTAELKAMGQPGFRAKQLFHCCLLYTSRGRRGHRQGAVPQLRGEGFPLRPPVRRIQRPRADHREHRGLRSQHFR